MKTFDKIYEELQSKNSSDLTSSWEAAKKESKKSKKISAIICIMLDIFLVLKFLNSGSITFNLFFVIMLIFVSNIMVYVIVSILFNKNNKEHTIKYKNIVINKLMDNFYNNVEYFPNKSMPEYIYEEGCYNDFYNRYMSEDYMEGQIKDKYSIQMGEVKTQKVETYRDSNGRTQTRTTTIFYGLFSKIIMEKSINSELKIMQNGEFFSKQRLEMDSTEFEKCFDVKASNKIVGMQLLTSDVMQELIDFQKNTNIRYDIVIKNDELYLRFHCGEMFEVGKLKNGPLDRETVKKYFYMLNFTYNLSNKLINIINETEI